MKATSLAVLLCLPWAGTGAAEEWVFEGDPAKMAHATCRMEAPRLAELIPLQPDLLSPINRVQAAERDRKRRITDCMEAKGFILVTQGDDQ